MTRMLKGTGDFPPPEGEDPPACGECEGTGWLTNSGDTSSTKCGHCKGTGEEPEKESDGPDDPPEPDDSWYVNKLP